MNYRDFYKLLQEFPEELQKRVINLSNIPQRPDFHPEGDTLVHTLIVFNRTKKYNNPILTISALFHDIGKDVTTKENDKGILQAIGHELVSCDLVITYKDDIIKILNKLNYLDPESGFELIYNVVKQHMRFKGFNGMNHKKRLDLCLKPYFGLLTLFSECDSMKNVTDEEIKISKECILTKF